MSTDAPRPLSEPRDAATVVLVRPTSPAFEVLLLRRHGKSGFMANAYVFPGGKRDEADGQAPSDRLGLSGDEAAQVLGEDLTPERALGHFVAAARETWEEARVWLGTGPTASDVESGTLFFDLLGRPETQVTLAALRYLAFWTTPVVEPRRFATRFFVCEVPADQVARHDAHETTEHLWLAPAEAVARYAEGTLALAPPTLRILEELAGCPTVAAALALAPHAPMSSTTPEFLMDGTAACLVLPGDPLHPTAPGTVPDRFVLQGGRWLSVRPELSAA